MVSMMSMMAIGTVVTSMMATVMTAMVIPTPVKGHDVVLCK